MEKVIIADASGSMSENGKNDVMHYVLFSIGKICDMNSLADKPKIFVWNEDISEFTYSNPIKFYGKLNKNSLEKFFSAINPASVLFITDGCFSSEIKKFILDCKIRFTVLKIGCDCDTSMLKAAFGSNRIFETSDIVPCFFDFNKC